MKCEECKNYEPKPPKPAPKTVKCPVCGEEADKEHEEYKAETVYYCNNVDCDFRYFTDPE